MTTICIRCEKQFNSEYNLNKHLNKKIPCGTSLKCDRCYKLFYNKRDYDQHLSRKFPCKMSNDQSKLELKKIELEIQKINAVVRLEVEKDRSLRSEIKLKAIESRIIIQAEKAKELLQMKSEFALTNATAIENMKSERKERTSVQINITEINNYHNTIINYLSEKYLAKNEMTVVPKDVEKRMFIHIQYIFTPAKVIQLYNKSETIRDINNNIIMTLLNNDKYPHFRAFFFKKEKDQFYGVKLSLKATKEIQKIDYNADINPIIKSILTRVYNILINSVSDPNEFNTELQFKYNDLVYHNSVLQKLNGSLLECAKHSFDEENTLS